MYHKMLLQTSVIFVMSTVGVHLLLYPSVHAVAVTNTVTGLDAVIKYSSPRDDDRHQQHEVHDDQPDAVHVDPDVNDGNADEPPSVLTGQSHVVPVPVKVRRCELIRIDLCTGLGYNVTGFPNLVGHDTAADAEQQLNTFSPLIQYLGSSYNELKLFLCAVYVPMCTEQFRDVIGPCRSVCERVRRRCEPLLQNFGFPWPPALRCDRFHARNNVDDHMCMEGPEGSGNSIDIAESTLPLQIRIPQLINNADTRTIVDDDCKNKPLAPGCTSTEGTRCGTNGTASTTSSDTSSYELIRVWTTVWSVCATVSTLFVIVTFAIDTSRYTYADRVVLLSATCSAICAIAHLSRQAFVGSGSAGSSPMSSLTGAIDRQPCPQQGSGNEHRISASAYITRGEPTSNCTVAFVAVYYFWTAASLWWLVLTVLLTLQTTGSTAKGRRWTDAEIRRRLSTWFHLIAWSIPAIATIILLVRKEIAIDPISTETGAQPICYVQPGSASNIGLVLIPLSVLMTLGIVLLIVSAVRFLIHRLRNPRKCDRNVIGDDCKEAELLKQLQQQKQHQSQKPNSLTLKNVMTVGISVPVTLKTPSGKITDDDSKEANSTVRIAVIGVIGAVALVAVFTCLTHEYLHQSSLSVAAVIIKVLSSVLVAVVVGPWLVLSGQASSSWNGFVVRRRERKCRNLHRQQSKSSSHDRQHGFHCVRGGSCCSDVNSLSDQRQNATSRTSCATMTLQRTPGNCCSSGHGDDQNHRRWHQLPVATVANTPMMAACQKVPNTVSRSVTADKRHPSKANRLRPSMADHSECPCGVHRFHEQSSKSARQHFQTVGDHIKNPQPPPPSQCTASVSPSDHFRTIGSSLIDGSSSVSCKICRHQHHINQYLI